MSDEDLSGPDTLDDEDTDDLAAEDLQASYAQIAEAMSTLAAAEETPIGFKPARDQFDPAEVSFDSNGWLLRLLEVQGWLCLDEEIRLNLPGDNAEDVAKGLFSALTAEDPDECLSCNEDVCLPTELGASVLFSRLDSAVYLSEQFRELREALSRRAATEKWIELWEEERAVRSDPEPIRATTAIWPIQEFADKAIKGRLNLSPTYQRGDVWPTKHSQQLIISILRGIPLPSVILLKPQSDEAGKFYEVVDGKQRLTAILRFIGKHPKALELVDEAQALQEDVPFKETFANDYKKFRRLWKTHRSESLTATKEAEYYFPFRLPATSDVPREELAGRYYYEIRDQVIQIGSAEETVRDIFETVSEYKIPLIEYRDTAPRQIHEVFHLYNRQGKHLNAEEIRNALFHQVELMRLLLVASGDNEEVEDLAPFIPEEDRWRLEEMGRILTEYRFGTSRYRRTKLLSWLTALIMMPSLQEDGMLAVRSTAKQIDELLHSIERNSRSHPLADYSRLRQLVVDLHACLEAHSSCASWAPQFKDDREGAKWQELQLVASLIAVFLVGMVEDDVADVLDEHHTEIMEFTRTHLRPEKTQNKTQWGFIGKVSLGLLDLMGVDRETLEHRLVAEYELSCLSTLEAAARHYERRRLPE